MKNIRRLIATMGFCLLVFGAVYKVSAVLERKDSVIKYHDIMEDEFDVLFFGSSHVTNGIYPMELWDKYGIASYNCGGHGNRLPTTYWVLRNVLEEKELPEVVVIDIFMLDSEEKIRPERTGIDQQHISFDWTELSNEKLEMANYLLDDLETKMEFIAPITIYHDRWKELTQKDFKIPYGTGKGAEYRVKRTAPRDFSLIPQEDMILDDTLGKEYLCKMIEECQSRGIKVLLLNIPYPASEGQLKWGNSAAEIAQKYNVDYLNLFYEDTGVDFYTDCYDENSHLNPSGARKVTDYVGAYLRSNYQIPDRRQDTSYAHWYEDYRLYTEEKWEALRKYKNDPWTYMSLLHDSNLDICLFFNGESEMIYWGTPPKMVMNIADLQKFQSASNERKDYMLVVDNEYSEINEYLAEESFENLNTSFGTFRYTVRDENGVRRLSWNNDGKNYLLNDDGTMAEIVILAFDKNTHEMVDYARFNQNSGVAGQ